MPSFREDQAVIALANDKAAESLGPLQQAHASVEQAQGVLLRVTEGTSQADVSEALGLLAHALDGITEVQRSVSAAIQVSEGVANRL
jgi:hypothetical protein